MRREATLARSAVAVLLLAVITLLARAVLVQQVDARARADVPVGQTTTSTGLADFADGLDGWTPAGSPVFWQGDVGHDGPGAVAMNASGAFTAASSPSFSVTPGARYRVNAWVLSANSGHSVGIGLKFFDSSGSVIGSATQLSQPVIDIAGGWTRTYDAIGFAPTNAVGATALTVSMDDTTGVIDYFDDVTVSQTTGSPAPIAAPLRTVGTDVVDANGRRVRLHGVQLGGMRSMTWTPNTVSADEIDAARRWGANLLRLPVGENPFVPGDCSYDASYVATIDRIVNDVTSRGMVLLLDLHTNAVNRCGAWDQQQKMPDAEAVQFWQAAANRYKNNPLVAFDLYNEPYGVTDAEWRNGGTVSSGGATYQAVGMQKLYNTIRATGARNLIFASGRGFASIYPRTAPLTGATNLIWAVHAYTCPEATPANGGTCKSGPSGVEDPTGILDNFINIGMARPVMVTEFGWPDPRDGAYATSVASFADAHHWVGWNAFTFNVFTGSPFDLMKDNGPLWDPQSSGVSIINGMLGD